MVRLIADVNQGRVPILAGASEANIRDVLRMAGYYADLGADAISLVPPYYYKISDTSCTSTSPRSARHSPLDILLYNIPQFTQELSLDTMEELLAFERIFGTKDSSRDLPRIVNTIHRLRRHRPDYVVLNGCEEILLPAIVMGADGGTTATSGIVPEVVVELYDRAVAGDLERAKELQYRLLPLINLMLLGVNFPEGFRTGVAVRGFDAGPPRTLLGAGERDYLARLESEISCVLGDMGYSVRGARACPVTHLPPIVAPRRGDERRRPGQGPGGRRRDRRTLGRLLPRPGRRLGGRRRPGPGSLGRDPRLPRGPSPGPPGGTTPSPPSTGTATACTGG